MFVGRVDPARRRDSDHVMAEVDESVYKMPVIEPVRVVLI